MFRIFHISILTFFLSACNNATREEISKNSSENVQTDNFKQVDTLQLDHDKKDRPKTDPQTKTKNANNSTKKDKLGHIRPKLFEGESFNDENLNGKPITQQIEISKNTLENFPDTLVYLAFSRYNAYEHLFPKSIKDDFVNGISREQITYPETLIFRFELFENEFGMTPYLTKDIVVKRAKNGELYTE